MKILVTCEESQRVCIAFRKKKATLLFLAIYKIVPAAILNGINNSGVWVRYRDVENLIRNAPTIENRKKGKWYVRDITRYGGKPYICTVCGREANDVYHFCPSCGADMREKEKTDE